MSEDQTPPAQPEQKSKGFQVTLPMHHYRYLGVLARQRRLGIDENAIAAFILIRELDAMFDRGYHEKKLPAD